MRCRIYVAAGLAAGLLLVTAVRGSSGQAANAERAPGERPLPGVELAQALATATGIAITPLLGVSTVGAWKYYHADGAARRALPWYASKWFWIPGLLVGLLLVFKDPILGLVPGAKKPLDALDVLENKASAVVAAPAVVPMFVSALVASGAVPVGSSGEVARVSQAGLAALPGLLAELPQAVGITLGGILFLAAFFCIWLAFHAINVLILLSPFGLLDTLLRSVKLFVLLLLVGATFVHPYLGLAVALCILIIAVPLAGWSFRLMTFGAVLAADLVTRRHRRETPGTGGVRAFTAGRLAGARARTYGLIHLGEAGLGFSYRPWLVLRRRYLTLPPGSYHLGRGLLCPVVRLTAPGQGPETVLRLPPRYRSHEERLVAMLALAGVEDMPLLRGFKACLAWLRETAGRGSRQAAWWASQVKAGLG